ncbi:hypothetical protein [uncultured Pseudokineococcus sp.]|uniref:hypothetical protein n=1 Tax=uncultured Pseudokineococcus sp. TaxID=1642928 RepID=UPI002625473F|nr:hypothetical protein [uncultured Pseudokineococcus sp.]
MSALAAVLVVAGVLAWAVALGRQALPRPLRSPLWRGTARELGRDAARGGRELVRLHSGRWPDRSPQTKPRRASGSTSSRSS